MTIDPEMLGATIALVLGRTPAMALVGDLARVLEQQEEVLPWLVLRQAAFAGDREVETRLKALAGGGNRPLRLRPDPTVIDPESPARKREIEAVLGAIIADNLAGSGCADALGGLLHAHNATLPGRPHYDFRRRIVEQAPQLEVPDDIAEPEAES